MDLQTIKPSTVKLEGSIRAASQGPQQVRASVYIESSSLKFNDSSVQVINNNNVQVRDQNGNSTTLKKTGGQLNIIPLA